METTGPAHRCIGNHGLDARGSRRKRGHLGGGRGAREDRTGTGSATWAARGTSNVVDVLPSGHDPGRETYLGCFIAFWGGTIDRPTQPSTTTAGACMFPA